MFASIAIGIGIGVIFLNNQPLLSGGNTPINGPYLLADGTDYLLCDGTPILLA